MELYTPQNRRRARSLLFRWLLVAACFPAALQLLDLARILYSRIGYPYEIHWMDGGTLLHAQRLLEGRPLYPEFTRQAGFLPYPYPPFVYVALAGLGAIFGLDYAMARLLSITAIALGAALLARQVYLCFQGLSLPWVPALLMLGAIAAGFPITGGWYDAIMTDPVALTLTIVSGCLIAADPAKLGPRRLSLASVCMALTIFTKQSYALLVAWQILFVCRRNLRRGLFLGVVTAGGVATGLLLLQYLTDGNFLHYAGSQLLRHPIVTSELWKSSKILLEFAPYLPFALLLSLWLGFKRALSAPALLWSGTLVCAFVMALFHSAKVGGWINNFLPVVFLGPAASLCVLADACRWLGVRARAPVLLACVLGAGVLLLLRRYPRAPFVARGLQRSAAAQLNAFVAKLDGRVLIPARPFLAIRQGTRIEQIHTMPWYDALLAGHTDLSFDAFIQRNQPGYVILTDEEPARIVEALARDYFAVGRMPRETWPAQTLESEFINRDPAAPVYPGQVQWLLERSFEEPAGSRCLFEFESSSYEGWTARGDAFAAGPTPIDAQRKTFRFAGHGTVVGVAGNSYASSFSTKTGAGALGSLESAGFVIDRKHLVLRVGGGTSKQTRVELRIDGAVRHESSGLGNNFMHRVHFDLSADRGRSAQIAIVDDDPNSHILVDHVCLVDAVSVGPPG